MTSWAALGIALPYGTAGEVRTTCPRCSEARRKSRDACLAVNTDKGTWYCWHCGWKGALQARALPREPATVSRPPVQPDERKRAALRRRWSEARPLTPGDPVDSYLRRRGIALPLADFPTVLRYHPHLAYLHDDGQLTYHPAMVARVDAPSGHAVSLHRTYLTLDGRKADVPKAKKLMSAAIAGATGGGAIRLHPPGETLAVSEGIETALAVHLATTLPVWAAFCALALARLIVPPAVALVVICADHDPDGLAAARALARRLLSDHRRVKILTPDQPGADWADLQEVGHG
jgi:putative DNA primase/helicase